MKKNDSDELMIANKRLAFQNREKENRAAELVIANKELDYQNEEKENRAAELVIANKELAFQNEEKENRAAELVIANKELAFHNEEKEKRANELIIANKELAFQNEEKEKRAAELVIANKELAFQNQEKEKRAEELKSGTGSGKPSYQALTESEHRFRNMMETIPQIAWTNTTDGKFIFYNVRWYDYTGLTKKTNKITGLKTVFHPDDLLRSSIRFSLIRQNGEGGEFQLRLKRLYLCRDH